MRSGGIDQWDDEYPAIKDVEKDIQKVTAYGLRIDDRLVACITLNQFNDKEYADVSFENEASNALAIHRLAVHPEYQRQGIAVKMIAFAENYAVGNGFSSIRLNAFSLNPRALKLYENRGYIKRGSVSFRKGRFFLFEKALTGVS